MKSLGVRGRMLLWTLPVVNAAFGAVLLVATMTARSGLHELTDAELNLASRALGERVSRELDEAMADARATGRLDLALSALESDDPKNFVWYADELVRTKRRYAAIVVADDEGRIVGANTVSRAGAAIEGELRGRSVASEPWAQQVLERKKDEAVLLGVSRPAALADLLAPGEQVVGYALPVVDIMDEVVGSLTVFVSLAHLAELLDGYVSRSGGVVENLAMITDAGGAPVVLPAGLSAPAPALAGAAGELVALVDGRGERYRGGRVTLGGAAGELGLVAVLAKTEASLERPVSAMASRMWLVLLLGVAATTGVLAVVSGRLVGPIRRLSARIGRIEASKRLEPVEVETGDEVGALSQAFNRAFETIGEYQHGLEEKVRERTLELAEAKREVSEILDNMQQAIFTVNRDGRVNAEFSAHTREVFGREVIADAPILDLLGLAPEGSAAEVYHRMEFWLRHIFGSDDLQWMLTESERPPRISYRRPGGESAEVRALALEYAPIYGADGLEKVMIIAKDETELERLSDEVRRRERENEENLERAAVIARMDGELFAKFLEECQDLLVQCERALLTLEEAPDTQGAIHVLFRAMHTLKGNARIFELSAVQAKAHQVEDLFEQMRACSGPLSAEQLASARGGVEEVRLVLEEIEALGAKLDRGRSGSSVPMARVPEGGLLEVARQAKELARRSGTEEWGAADSRDRAGVLERAVRGLRMVPLAEVLAPLAPMVRDLARELGKPVADLSLSCEDLWIEAQGAAKLREAALHAVRNAIDHGIEPIEERRAKNKSELATLAIRVELTDGQVAVVVEDDGRGVDPGRVRTKAIEGGFATEEQLDRMSDEEVVALLFEPGFSTADAVSAVSGRGVGMDAIAGSMAEIEGAVELCSQVGEGTRLRLQVPAAICTAGEPWRPSAEARI